MSSDPCFVRSRHSWEALHFSKSCHLEQNLLSWNSWAPELSHHGLLPSAAPTGYNAPLSVPVSSRMSPAEQGHEHSPAVVWPGQGALGSCILWSALCATMNRVPTCLVFVAAAFLSWCLMRAPLFLFPFSLSFFYLAIIKPDLCRCSCNRLHKCICRRPSFSLGWTFLSLLSIWLPNIQYTSLISSLLWVVEIIEASLGFGGKWEEGKQMIMFKLILTMNLHVVFKHSLYFSECVCCLNISVGK